MQCEGRGQWCEEFAYRQYSIRLTSTIIGITSRSWGEGGEGEQVDSTTRPSVLLWRLWPRLVVSSE